MQNSIEIMIGKPPVQRENNGLLSRIIRHRGLMLLMVPGVAFLVIFNYIPMYGILLAFKDYDIELGIFNSPWVGLKHFKVFFSNPDIWNVVRNTVEISLLKLIFGFPAPIIFALLINELQRKSFKKVVQTISYLPNFLSWVVVAGLLNLLLDPTNGIYRLIMDTLGHQPIALLASHTFFRPVLIISDIWKGVGWGSIIYLASIAGIDTQLYEAAYMDGAGRLRQAIHITLPGLAPVVGFLLIMSVSSLLNAGFDQIFNLYNPIVYKVTDVIDTYVYRMGLASFEYELSTAINLSKTLVAFVLLIIANSVTKKFSEYSIW
jgi:putative aldouronate transport system permease protein